MSRFDLVDILRALFRKKKFIIYFTIASVVLGTVWALFQQDRFTSRTIFIVKGMATLDRNQMFRQTAFPDKQFFATEDEIDYIVTIGQSDNLRGYIADKFNMGEVYGLKDPAKVSKKIKRRFKLTRNDTKNMELYFTDEDPKRAQAIGQAATDWIEDTYRQFFIESNKDILKALKTKTAGMDTLLLQLEDSIQTLRAQYGIYNQLLPLRGTALATAPQAATAQQAAGMEQLQQLTSLKDQLIADRANFHSLMNEYTVGVQEEKINMFYRVQQADEPNMRSFPNLLLIIGICLVAGFFFACILVVLQASAQQINRES